MGPSSKYVSSRHSVDLRQLQVATKHRLRSVKNTCLVFILYSEFRPLNVGVGQSVRSLKCPGQSVRRESQSVRGRSPPRSMCYKHRRSRPSGTYEPLAVGSIETYIFYFYLTSIHIIYKVAKPNHNVVGPGRID